jgi:5-formyltetrahydrofolate cyclo-ligase
MSKEQVRERIWSLVTKRRVARFPGAAGRIPNFVGAEAAALRLAGLPQWRAARVIKANPDAPQRPVRTQALLEGKRVFMAVPRLRTERCFLELDPRRLRGRERRAASITGASALGRPVHPRDMARVDLVVAGSVAVQRDGARVGKGGGFSDLEWAVLAELGLVGPWTTVVTTVHPLQIVRRGIPMLPHDVPLDRIITPTGIIQCPRRHPRPTGIIWDALEPEKIAEVPLLARLARSRRGPRRR